MSKKRYHRRSEDGETIISKFFSKIFRFIGSIIYSIQVKLHKIFHKKEKKLTMSSVKRRRKIFYAALLAYPLAQFIIFYVLVNFNSILLSFQTWSTETSSFYFTGFNNFKDVINDLFNDADMKVAFLNSIKIYLAALLIGLPLNLIFSFLMYKKIPGNGAFRIVLFLPQIISSLVISLMFKYIVEYGLGNLGGKLAFDQTLLSNRKTGFPTIIFYCIWASFGTQILIYTNAFSKINPELVEYGKLEGMNMWQEFFHISIPSIFPTITVFLVAGVAGIFTNQAALYNFYGAGASTHMQTLGYIFFVKVLKNNDAAFAQYPYASAAGLIFTIVAAPITLLVKRLLEKYGPNEG